MTAARVPAFKQGPKPLRDYHQRTGPQTTPGPWVVGRTRGDVTAGAIRIRQLPPGEAYHGCYDTELRANAALISAAPELRDVCAELLALLRTAEVRQPGQPTEMARAMPIYQKLRDALEKANTIIER